MENSEIRKCQVKGMPEDYLAANIGAEILKTFQTAGQPLTDETHTLITIEVTKDIMKAYSMLSLEEIQTAFYEGVRSNLCEFYGLNIVTFNKWLKYWKENNHYNYVIKNQPKQRQIEQHQEPTEEEKEQILMNGVNRCYNHWLNHKKEIIDYGNPVYDFLVQKGYIKHTDVEWQNYMLKAEIEVVKAYREQTISIDRIERQGAKRVLKDMEIGGEVESLAKRLALSDYFEIVKKTNQ